MTILDARTEACLLEAGRSSVLRNRHRLVYSYLSEASSYTFNPMLILFHEPSITVVGMVNLTEGMLAYLGMHWAALNPFPRIARRLPPRSASHFI